MALFLSGAALALGADVVSDGIRADLARERRRLTTDSRALADTTRRLEAAASELASAARSVSEAASRTDVGVEEVARREDLLSASEQEVRSLLDRRRILAERVIERRRSIALLEADLLTKKPPDGLTGRWSVLLEPGEQKGVFRIRLDGTIVAGEYMLEGGDTGSLRGTLVNGRLRVERVDSKKGFSTVYFGSLARDGQSIAGTWEATTFGTGGPGSGRWRAVRDESGGEESP
ncbi:MAG TPA: hypothetical protein VE007_03315 [Thermoanaerobaculia bacterium]|nr:hypothetical protein [Thermoanaerobaculia bacterium]